MTALIRDLLDRGELKQFGTPSERKATEQWIKTVLSVIILYKKPIALPQKN